MKISRKYLTAVAGLGIAAFATPVLAADVTYEEPPVAPAPIVQAPVSTWAGPYAGVQGGYGFEGDVNLPGVGMDTEGFYGGVFGGYQMQNGMFVYGAEADANLRDMDGSAAGIDAQSSIDGSIRARAGVAVTDDVLIYGTAGGAAERLRIEGGGDSDTNVMLGYTVGAGVDARLTDQVFARTEYRYTDYMDKDFELNGVEQEVDSSNHRVGVGLGIKF